MYEQRLAQASEGAKGAAESNADAEKSKIILPN
jgi:hypothetical protein